MIQHAKILMPIEDDQLAKYVFKVVNPEFETANDS